MRRATVLATAVLAMGALAAPAMAVAPEDVPEGAAAEDRIDGETRYDTAAQTALRTYPEGADTVLVATGEKFPDALAASFLAGGVDAPIVLVEREEIPSFTAAALDELNPTNLLVLGREDAISNETYAELEALEGVDSIDRIGGDTRRETAAMIATRTDAVGTMRNLSVDDSEDELPTAIVARADEFPDALASGPLALAGQHPILLTDHGELPQVTIAALEELGIQQVILPGGPVAISQEVEDQLNDLDGMQNVERIAGDIRTETAVMLGELTRAELGWDGTNISLARGDNFPDALTLAPLAVQDQASLFLSRNPETIEGHTFAGIQELCDETENLLVSGGPVAISDDALGEALLATVCADNTFPISWEQSTDGGKEGAEGTGWVTVDGDTICTVYDVKGLEGNATASHIHEGERGTAPDDNVVLDLGTPNSEGFLATCDSDAELAAQLELSPWDYYVNIHTGDKPLGAARGQIAEEPQVPGPGDYENDLMLFGEAVLDNDAADDTLVAGANLATNDAGELCLTVEGLDATDATTATIYEGAVDQGAQGEALATFEELGTDPVCTTEVDPRFWLMAGDMVHLSITDSADAEIARGQIEATQQADLMDPAAAEGAEAVGTAALYRGAAEDTATLCGAIAVDEGTFTFSGENATVTDAEDAEVAVFDGASLADSVDFACDDSATAEDAATITVPVNESAEDLVGDFTADEEPAPEA